MLVLGARVTGDCDHSKAGGGSRGGGAEGHSGRGRPGCWRGQHEGGIESDNCSDAGWRGAGGDRRQKLGGHCPEGMCMAQPGGQAHSHSQQRLSTFTGPHVWDRS